ncbi:hypothetical protein FOA52_006319 [Chlamydomonas sp. UWO 241]|nr:hypothetical protein FOA52_006319 [Chlamydomonas sp. UWO 241]
MGCGASAPVPEVAPVVRNEIVNVTTYNNIIGLATGATVTNRPIEHISYRAVSLKWLVTEFVQKYPEVVEEGLTGKEVVSNCIIPATAKYRDSYVELLRKEGGPKAPDIISRGRPFYYVSHSWGRPFSEMLVMLKEHFCSKRQAVWRKGKPEVPWAEVYIWIDVLAVDQHSARDVEVSSWTCTVREMVQDAEMALLVLDKEGEVLDRVETFFDAWAVGNRGGRGGQERLVMLSLGMDSEGLDLVVAGIDEARLLASGRTRAEMMDQLEDDASTFGMSPAWKESMADSAGFPTEKEARPMLEGYDKAALTCQLYGRYNKAEDLFNRALELREGVFGPDHPETITNVCLLASLLKRMGRGDEAELLFERVIGRGGSQASESQVAPSVIESSHTRVDQSVVMAQSHNGSVLDGDMSDLAAWFTDHKKGRGVDGGTQSVGGRGKFVVMDGDDPNNLAPLMEKLGNLLAAQASLDEAEQSFKDALLRGKARLGADDKHTRDSMNKLAKLLQAQGLLQPKGGHRHASPGVAPKPRPPGPNIAKRPELFPKPEHPSWIPGGKIDRASKSYDGRTQSHDYSDDGRSPMRTRVSDPNYHY